MKVILQINNVSKSFGGLKAISNVNLFVPEKKIYGLIGPNGAGKTTLFNILTGLYQPDEGSFKLDGKKYSTFSPHQVAKAGIARTFQNIRLFNDMTAIENVMVGRHLRTNQGILGAIFRFKKTMIEEKLIYERAKELLEFVGIEHLSVRTSRFLSYGDQRRVEIARALATDPLVLALDEPAAGMNASEKKSLRKLLLKIRDKGITILIIEHDMKLVMNLCDRVTVLNYGSVIAEGLPSEIQNNSYVIKAYLGENS